MSTFIEFRGQILHFPQGTSTETMWMIAINQHLDNCTAIVNMWTAMKTYGCSYANHSATIALIKDIGIRNQKSANRPLSS